ncbi:hypothetical protein N665_0104s0293 [Sinapis alba]|nr:hypothetical protein N665_0104s0293 [Sinapis alba]
MDEYPQRWNFGCSCRRLDDLMEEEDLHNFLPPNLRGRNEFTACRLHRLGTYDLVWALRNEMALGHWAPFTQRRYSNVHVVEWLLLDLGFPLPEITGGQCVCLTLAERLEEQQLQNFLPAQLQNVNQFRACTLRLQGTHDLVQTLSAMGWVPPSRQRRFYSDHLVEIILRALAALSTAPVSSLLPDGLSEISAVPGGHDAFLTPSQNLSPVSTIYLTAPSSPVPGDDDLFELPSDDDLFELPSDDDLFELPGVP